MIQSEYISICLHEAGHCVTAWALGLPVSRLAAVIRPDDRVAGECHITLLTGDLTRSIAVLMAGINSCNLFGHLPITISDEAITKGQPKAIKHRRKPPLSLAKGISDDPLGRGRDGHTIIRLLNGNADSGAIFGQADELSRRTLSANDRVTRLLTMRLAERGELLACDIRDLARQVTKIEV